MNVVELSEVCLDGMRECLEAGGKFKDFDIFIVTDEYVSDVRKVELRRNSKTGDFCLSLYT